MGAAFEDWIGKTEAVEEWIAPAPVRAATAMLDDTTTATGPGSPLPPLWHWFYFLPLAPQAQLGADGHPARGGFLPPIDLPRRMFAGARLRFVRPLLVGKPAQRRSLIRDVTTKQGRTGALAFVTVAHQIDQEGAVCIEEEQDIVYREPGAPVAAPEPCALPPAPEGAWTRLISPTPTLLFRFSALTFNAHRIHYDRPYATGVEGYPGLVVQGPLTALLLLELARTHAQVQAQVQRPVARFEFRARAPLFDLDPFRLLARPDGPRVHLEAQGPDGQTTMNATARWD
jgi:3-methylfumaryl-CoA hydratase